MSFRQNKKRAGYSRWTLNRMGRKKASELVNKLLNPDCETINKEVCRLSN